MAIQFGNKGARPPQTLLRYGANAYALPRELEEQLISYCEAVGVPWQNILITNTFRTKEDQARILSSQYTPASAAPLYTGAKGTLMVAQWKFYMDGGYDSYNALLMAMEDSGWVSNHMRDDRATVDIDPASVPVNLREALLEYCRGLKTTGEVIEVAGPAQGDKALHISFNPSGNWLARAESAAAAAVGLDEEGGEGPDLIPGVPDWLAIGSGLGLLYWAWRKFLR